MRNDKAFILGISEDSCFYIDEMDNYFDIGVANLLNRARRDQHFILTPSYNVSRTPAITFRSKINNIPLIVYHSEQFFADYYDEEKFSLNRIKEYINNVDAHLVWGNYFKDKLLSHGIPEHKIFVVGNIKNEVALYTEISGVNINKKNNKYYDYLFVSSFSLAEMTNEEFSTYQKQFHLPNGIDERVNAAKCRLGMIDFIADMATINPDKRILVRRHPGESAKGYERLESLRNVEFSNMGPFSIDALSTSLVLLQDSTSVFELETLGVDWISVDFHETPPLYLVEPKSLFKRHSKKHVQECLFTGDYQSILGKNEVEKFNIEYFVGLSDKLTSVRIADAIFQVMSRPRENKIFLNNIYEFIILMIKSLICVTLKCHTIAKLPFFKVITNRLMKNKEYRDLAEHYFSTSDVKKSLEMARTWKNL